jgi:hypothetical protein
MNHGMRPFLLFNDSFTLQNWEGHFNTRANSFIFCLTFIIGTYVLKGCSISYFLRGGGSHTVLVLRLHRLCLTSLSKKCQGSTLALKIISMPPMTVLAQPQSCLHDPDIIMQGPFHKAKWLLQDPTKQTTVISHITRVFIMWISYNVNDL